MVSYFFNLLDSTLIIHLVLFSWLLYKSRCAPKTPPSSYCNHPWSWTWKVNKFPILQLFLQWYIFIHTIYCLACFGDCMYICILLLSSIVKLSNNESLMLFIIIIILVIVFTSSESIKLISLERDLLLSTKKKKKTRKDWWKKKQNNLLL